MSLYRYSGREKIANWLLTCLYIDLIICGLVFFLNFNTTYGFITGNTVGIGLGVLVFCFYVAILDTIRQKILEYRQSSWKIFAEVIASLYCYFHCFLYILIIGSVLSGIYYTSAGVPVSSDFLMSWAIILATLVLGLFYLKNKEKERYTKPPGDYPDIPVSPDDVLPDDDFDLKPKGEKGGSPAGAPSQSYELNCFICGKLDPEAMKGKDGRYYCQDHILLANQIFTAGVEQSIQKTGQKTDIQCSGCRRYINRKDAIKCGPCENLFCARCWEAHRWNHGTSPAMGISYRADGTYSGYDGTESYRK